MKKEVSTGWIVFWCIFFWPVGIYLVYKKIARNSNALYYDGKGIMIASIILIIFGVIGIFGAFSESESSSTIFTAVLIFVTPGVFLFLKANKMKENSEKYQKYSAMITYQNITKLSDIANAINLSIETIKNDLELMIKNNYFPNSYIDEKKLEIILSDRQSREDGAYTREKALHARVVKCEGCGAEQNVPEGKIIKCEYCGSLLENH